MVDFTLKWSLQFRDRAYNLPWHWFDHYDLDLQLDVDQPCHHLPSAVEIVTRIGRYSPEVGNLQDYQHSSEVGLVH